MHVLNTAVDAQVYAWVLFCSTGLSAFMMVPCFLITTALNTLKSGSIKPLALFLLRMILTIGGFVTISYTFQNFCSVKNVTDTLTETTLNLQVSLSSTDMLTA